jgi:hypothetical protein
LVSAELLLRINSTSVFVKQLLNLVHWAFILRLATFTVENFKLALKQLIVVNSIDFILFTEPSWTNFTNSL